LAYSFECERGSQGLTTVAAERAVNTLHALTSFETFDALADSEQTLTDVVRDVLHLAEAALLTR